MSYVQSTGLRRKLFILLRTFTFVYITDQDPRVRVYCSTRPHLQESGFKFPKLQVIYLHKFYFKCFEEFFTEYFEGIEKCYGVKNVYEKLI